MLDQVLGRFGDRRLEKGGRVCCAVWSIWAALAFGCDGSAATGLGKCS